MTDENRQNGMTASTTPGDAALADPRMAVETTDPERPSTAPPDAGLERHADVDRQQTAQIAAVTEHAVKILNELHAAQIESHAAPSPFGQRRPAVTLFYSERTEPDEQALRRLEEEGLITITRGSSWQVRLTDECRERLDLPTSDGR